MKKRILFTTHNHIGDSLISTATVKDFMEQYGDDFSCNVNMVGMGWWENNPYLDRSINEKNAQHIIKLEYDRSQRRAESGNCISGWAKRLSEYLYIKVTVNQKTPILFFTKDELERPPVIDEKYMIIDAGFQTCSTVKNWGHYNYQAVVDELRDDIRFVQVGGKEERCRHSVLNGVINMIGKTSLRDMALLMFHSEGCITPVSMPVHLAGALGKPSFVISGGREKPELTKYPDGHYFSTIGKFSCCSSYGCFKFFSEPGDPIRSCVNSVRMPGGEYIPMCMVSIDSKEVVNKVRECVINARYEKSGH